MDDFQTRVIQGLQLHQESNKGISIPNWALDLVDNDFHTAIFLKQVVFWSTKTNHPDGFYKSYKEWESESRLSRYHVQQAIKVIHEASGCELITITKKKVNGAPTLFYKLDWEALHQWICKSLTNGNEIGLQMEMQNNSQMDLQELRTSLRADRDLHTDTIQTEIADLHSLPSPIANLPTTPAAAPTNETGNIIPFSSDEPLVLKALCELCGISGPNAVKRARATLQKLAAMTPGGEAPPNPRDFIRFRYYMKAVNARPEPPTLAYVEDGWQRYLEWFAEPHGWTARYWRERGWPKGVSRDQLLNAHDLMACNPTLMEVAE